MTDTDTDASRSAASETAPDSPAACKVKKARLAGLPPRKSAVEALLKSLEARGVLRAREEGRRERAASRRAAETAESRLQAVADSGASGAVLPFRSRRK